MLDRLTFTGADDSVNPHDLIAISRSFPYVEWGILFSMNSQGAHRFPSAQWLNKFHEVVNQAAAASIRFNTSAHLCGKYVRDFVIDGNASWFRNYSSTYYDRIQINFHGQFHKSCSEFHRHVLKDTEHQYILQFDGENDAACHELLDRRLAVPLFDTSAGAGILPETWPRAFDHIYCGFAGGLSPDNIENQLHRILDASRRQRFWIDMERNVRSADDSVFDLNKVLAVIAVVERFRKNGA